MKTFLKIIAAIALVLVIAVVGMWRYFIVTHTPDRNPDYQSRIHYLWEDISDADIRFNWDGSGDDEMAWLVSGLASPFMKQGPYLVAYPTESTTSATAVLILPGGGYAFRSELREGVKIAKWLNDQGIAAFILNYRLQHHPAPLDDTKLAMRYLRKNADQFGVNPNRVGVMGFSAGGYLAASISTLYDHPTLGEAPPTPMADYSSRPDFAILAYAVISFENYPQSSSEEMLLGVNPDPQLIQLLSLEQQVKKTTPPSFVWAPKTDFVVPYENSVVYADALAAAGVEHELHIFPEGSHGSDLAANEEYAKEWPALMLDWLRRRGFL